MPYLDEVEYADEIRGVQCPECGGSLVWLRGRAYCDEHRYVEPVPEQLTPDHEYTDEELNWILTEGGDDEDNT